VSSPANGRRAQAAANDERILAAAREVFVAEPGAPIAAVAARAGVGISALYRRHGSKDDLLRRLCSDGLAIYIEAARTALAGSDPWSALVGFLRRVVEADTHALTVNLAGRFTPDERLDEDAALANRLNIEIVDRAHEAGVLRADVVATDLGVVFEQLASIRGGDSSRTAELRTRYLDLLLDAMRTPPAHRPLGGAAPLPGEFADRWRPSEAGTDPVDLAPA
jgi:AcrR family transcriptional regulator